MKQEITIDEADEVAVTEDGAEISFTNGSVQHLLLIAHADNTDTLGYSFKDATLLDGSAPADEAALITAKRRLLKAGEVREVDGMTLKKLYLRAPATKTLKVRIET